MSNYRDMVLGAGFALFHLHAALRRVSSWMPPNRPANFFAALDEIASQRSSMRAALLHTGARIFRKLEMTRCGGTGEVVGE